MQALLDKINKTKNARFTAYRRMKRNKTYANLAVVIFSFYIIVINTLVYLPGGSRYSDLITISTIWLSVFILIISQIIAQQQYEIKEKNYHDCGNRLNELADRIALSIETEDHLTKEQKEEYLSEYHSIIDYFQLNHNENDYHWAYREWRKGIRNYVKSFIMQYILDASFFYLALIFIPFPLLMWLICSVLV